MTYTKWDTAPLVDHNVAKTCQVLCDRLECTLQLPAAASHDLNHSTTAISMPLGVTNTAAVKQPQAHMGLHD